MNEKNLKSENKVKISKQPFFATSTYEKDYPEIMAVEYRNHQLTATLSDGRIVSIPTVWFKRLREANEEQLRNYELLPDGYGITWPELDEDISVKAFINGLS